jgi:hypothetical protein
MTDHIDEREDVRLQRTDKPFEYYYTQRLKANLRRVQPGDEIGAKRAEEVSRKQAKDWEFMVMQLGIFCPGRFEDELEHYRNFDPENPQPLDLQNLPFDPAAQAMIGCFAATIERVRAWACEDGE